MQMKLFKKKLISFKNQDNASYSGIDELIDAERGLKNYNNDVVLKFAKGLGISKSSRSSEGFVEFGAGTGSLADVWQTKFGLNPVCIEIDPALIQILESKGFTTFSSISLISNKISYVYTSNVLEHIDNDVEALNEIRKKLKSGGKLAIYVPALPFLYSGLDKKVGHYRRYTRRELIKKVTESGFTVKDCFYNDSLGIFASLTVKTLGYKNNLGLGASKSIVLYDKVFFPISKILDRLIFRRVIGKNLFLFAVNE
jgi:SAM-dependent methyltransferase